jgi:hypothetical protein
VNKLWKPCFATLIGLCLFGNQALAEENATLSPDDEVPPAQPAPAAYDNLGQPWTLPKYEPYRGFEKAIQRAYAEERASMAQRMAFTPVPGTGPWLAGSRFFDCDEETLSVNAWLISRHEKKERAPGRELEENNRGWGVVYSCNGWSVGLDRMVNSNRGQAVVFSVVWGTRVAEIGPVFFNGTIGYARVSYGVPKYNATLYDNSVVGFGGVGLTRWPEWTVNIAPVPKVAGNAYILWVNYELIRFKGP